MTKAFVIRKLHGNHTWKHVIDIQKITKPKHTTKENHQITQEEEGTEELQHSLKTMHKWPMSIYLPVCRVAEWIETNPRLSCMLPTSNALIHWLEVKVKGLKRFLVNRNQMKVVLAIFTWDKQAVINDKEGRYIMIKGLLQQSESEVAQSCPTLCDPMDFSPPG